MVTVQVVRRAGHVVEFESKGHAEVDNAGKDIVCAAVSAILQTALLGLTDYAGLQVESHMAPGHMRVSMPPLGGSLDGVQCEKTDAILETMLLGLESVRLSSDRVRIIQREV